jgi:hypothetical protein
MASFANTPGKDLVIPCRESSGFSGFVEVLVMTLRLNG